MAHDPAQPLRLRSYLGGASAWEGESCAELEIVDPWLGGVAAVLECGGEGAVDRAVRAAQAAYLENRGRTRACRAGWLEAAADLIAANEARLTDLAVRMIGKPCKAAKFEVLRSAAFVRACARQIHHFGGELVPLDSSPAGAGRHGLAERVPYGVVSAVTPFNAPANLLVQKVAPAVATGNAIVVKPSPEGAAIAIDIAHLFREAGLPDGLFQVVLGGADEALGLAVRPETALVTLTGGTAAGEALARAAGAKPFLGELGGNSANIVCADADLDDASERIAASAFEASGQQCISAQRIVVQAGVYDRFVERFLAATKRLKVGDPSDPTTDLGPVVHERAAARIMDLISAAEAQGASLLTAPNRKGCVIEPTIVANAPRAARIVQEEIFGPVAVLLRVESLDEAIAVTNDCAFGLQAACFTQNLDAAFKVGREVRAGSVWINEASRFRLDNYPFGGFGKSGSGREGVRFAMEAYTTWKFLGIRPPGLD